MGCVCVFVLYVCVFGKLRLVDTCRIAHANAFKILIKQMAREESSYFGCMTNIITHHPAAHNISSYTHSHSIHAHASTYSSSGDYISTFIII